MTRESGVIFPVLDWTVYVEAIWYLSYESFDLLAMLYREPKTGPWQLRMRFRHYRDNETWESKDEKNVYDVTADPEWPNPRDRLTALMDTVIAGGSAIIQETPVHHKKIVVKGDGEKAGEILMKQPFAHAKSAGSWLSSDPKRPH